MKKHKQIAFIFLFSIMIVTFASDALSKTEVILNDFTFQYNQFLFPRIENNNTDYFSAGKTYNFSPSSFLLQAQTFLTRSHFETPNDFIIFYKDILNKRSNADYRHKELENNVELAQSIGKYCAKYHLLLLDKESKVFPTGTSLINVYGYTCLHPKQPNELIELNYSVRNQDGKIDQQHKQIGEEFINSLKFK